MTRTITIEKLSRFFGYRNKKEFVQDAIREKTNRLKELAFSRSAERVRRGIQKKGLTEEKILEDFRQFQHK